MDCAVANTEKAAPLQVSILSSGMNTSQESILLDLSALDSNSSSKGAHESLEERNKGVSLIGDNVTLENFKTKDHTTEGAEEDMSHELHHKGVPLLAHATSEDKELIVDNLKTQDKTSLSIELLEDIEPPSMFFDNLDFSDDVTVNVLSQESDISNCDSDSGSDWSFLDDEWWKIKPTAVEEPPPSSTTAAQRNHLTDDQLVVSTDYTQGTHIAIVRENNQIDEHTKEDAVCSDSTVRDSEHVTFCVPITNGDDVHVLESEAESTQPTVHQQDVIISSELTCRVANEKEETVAISKSEREPDSTVTLLKEESVPRALSVECSSNTSEVDCGNGKEIGGIAEVSGVGVTGDRCSRFKSRLPSPKVKSFSTKSPVKCSQLEELRELRNVTFIRPPYTTDTQFPHTDDLPSTTFIKPSKSDEVLPVTYDIEPNTTIVIPTVKQPTSLQEQFNDPLTKAVNVVSSEDKDSCVVDNEYENDGVPIGCGGGGDKNQEDLNTSGSSVQSQASSVSSTASRESKESGGIGVQGGCDGGLGVSLKSKLPRKSGIPRSTSDNNLTKASKPLNKTYISKIPNRRPISKLKKPSASIKPRLSKHQEPPSKSIGIVPTGSVVSKPHQPTSSIVPTSSAQSLDAIPSENTSTNDNPSTFFDPTVVYIRSQTSDVDSVAVQSTPRNVGGGGAIEATPTRSRDVQHVRPNFSLSSIDSEGSTQKAKPGNIDETYTMSTPIVDNELQTPNKRNRRSLIPTPSGKDMIGSRRIPHQNGPIPYHCGTPDSSPLKTATNQQENPLTLMPPPKTKGLLNHGRSTRPTGLKKPKQIRPKGNLIGGVGVGSRGVFKPRNGRITKPRNGGPLTSQVYKLEKEDDMAAMMSRPKMVHSPLDKENRPATPHSKWSPIKRNKPMSFEDACIQCTKRV